MPPARPSLEITAVLLTGALHLLFEEVLHAKGAFIALACLAWGGYVALRCRQEPGVWRRWGLGAAGLRPSLRAALFVLLLGSLGIAAVALARGTFALHWHLLPLLLVYPLWGIVQQVLLLGLVAANLSELLGGRKVLVTAITAVLFGCVHWPDPILVGATFLLGLVFTPIYLRWRNLWALGIVHGWLGALIYFLVLGRDPVAELLGP